MDAKVGEYCVTPRNGKAVEINAMWYNALKIAEELTELYGTKEQEKKKYNELAEKCKKELYREVFTIKKKKMLI